MKRCRFLKLHKQNRYKGGEKASRNNPKCYNKQNQKEKQSTRKTSFLRKHLSLETVHTSLGISVNPLNLLRIWTSQEIQSVKQYITLYLSGKSD